MMIACLGAYYLQKNLILRLNLVINLAEISCNSAISYTVTEYLSSM